jgi:hypothetical protein
MNDPQDTVSHREWVRYGRGRSFQFFVTSEEFLSVLYAKLPQDSAPLFLIGVDILKVGKAYKRMPFTAPLSNLPQLAQDNRANNMYWIWSTQITPYLKLDSEDPQSECAVNGLILLRHGAKERIRVADGKTALLYGPSSIGMVHKIEHATTGKTREHTEYAKMFSQIKRALRNILVYTTIRHFSDGTSRELNDQLMSEGAAQLCREGHPFLNTIGRRIR